METIKRIPALDSRRETKQGDKPRILAHVIFFSTIVVTSISFVYQKELDFRKSMSEQCSEASSSIPSSHRTQFSHY